MATSKVQLNPGWTAVVTGPCRIDRQTHSLGATAGELAIIGASKDPIYVHIGTVLPVGSIQESHQMKDSLVYTGTETVYMGRVALPEIVVVTPIV